MTKKHGFYRIFELYCFFCPFTPYFISIILLMIFSDALPIIIEKELNGIELKYVKKSTGEIVEFKDCICTSSRFRPRTYNLKCKQSGEIRKIRHSLIIEINGIEVYGI